MKRFLATGLGLSTATAALGWPAAGMQAVAGVALGAFISGFSIAALSATVHALARTKPAPRQGMAFLWQGMAFLWLSNVLKWPLVMAGIWLATRLSTGGMYCFLVEMLLVYSLTVWSLAVRPGGRKPDAIHL